MFAFVLKFPDLDECATDPEACEQDSLCVNLPGSYACQCKLGYHLTDNSCHGNYLNPSKVLYSDIM